MPVAKASFLEKQDAGRPTFNRKYLIYVNNGNFFGPKTTF